MRDALEMEWIGIPAVSIAHEALAGSVEAMKSICMMPDYPYLQVRYPLSAVGGWTDDEVTTLVEKLVPQIVDLLTDTGYHAKYGPQTKERTSGRAAAR